MDKIKTLTVEQQQLVEDNLGLVYKVINDKFEFLYGMNGIEIEDFEQVGKLALCKAARQYNPARSKFSTFAYILIRQELSDAVTKSCLTIDNEVSPNDILESSDDIDVEGLPADASDFFADQVADFSESLDTDIRDAITSFYEDYRVRDTQKAAVTAFLIFVFKGCSLTEAGLAAGASTKGYARNLVARGRDILKNRKEFRQLWEALTEKALAS